MSKTSKKLESLGKEIQPQNPTDQNVILKRNVQVKQKKAGKIKQNTKNKMAGLNSNISVTSLNIV